MIKGIDSSKIKVVITDADGTFTNYEAKVPNSAYIAAKKLKEKGIILVIATGRSLATYKFIPHIELFDYVIGGSGTFCLDAKNKELLFSDFLSFDDSLHLIKQAKKLKIPWFAEMKDKVVISSLIPPEKKAKFNRYIGTSIECIFSDRIYESPTRLLFFRNPELKTKSIKDLLFSECKCNLEFNSFESFESCEVVTKNNSKWKGVEKLLKIKGWNQSEVIAIGDSANDLEMITKVDNSIAMGNALAVVKNAATFTTQAVKDNGWKQAFEKLEMI